MEERADAPMAKLEERGNAMMAKLGRGSNTGTIKPVLESSFATIAVSFFGAKKHPKNDPSPYYGK